MEKIARSSTADKASKSTGSIILPMNRGTLARLNRVAALLNDNPQWVAAQILEDRMEDLKDDLWLYDLFNTMIFKTKAEAVRVWKRVRAHYGWKGKQAFTLEPVAGGWKRKTVCETFTTIRKRGV